MKIIHNARIHTMDGVRPRASAVAVDHGRIISISDDRTILSEFSDRAGKDDLINLDGKTVIPGLIDAHIHLEKYARVLLKVDCEVNTKQECLQRIAERAGKVPAGTWILGHGWNQNNWADGYGTAAELDKVAAGHPVYLTAKSLHAAWANSLALRKANIGANFPDPVGGKLKRDRQGRPDGILFEDAMNLVSAVIPELTTDEVVNNICQAQSELWRLGLTGLHDFDRRKCFMALQRMHRNGDLKLRIVKSIPLEDLDHAVEIGLRSGFGDDYLRIGSVKLFADGALGPQTAAMLQPYDGESDNLGMLLKDAEEIIEHGRKAVSSGLSLAVHAIGDRANNQVLNAFSEIRKFEWQNMGSGDYIDSDKDTEAQNLMSNPDRLRHRIEHVQLIHQDDRSRLSELGIIASMQPIHATSDMQMADRFWGSRCSNAYAWRTQLDLGTVLAFGSDAPVESPNPFLGIHAAITRRRQDGKPGQDGWYPEQKVSLLDALRAYTVGPAYAADLEHKQGKLAEGYYADLVVLNEDIFSMDPDEIWKIAPLATMVGGNWVYRSD
jgi:predicted amidohydrolase YtcJ